MEYKQIESKTLKIVGIGVDTSTENAAKDCLPAWMDFMKRLGEIDNQVNPQVMYGASFVINQKDCTFHYVAGVEVIEFGEKKDGLEQIEIPASNYLVFTHKGKLDTLGQTYSEIMQEMTKSGKEQQAFWIEYYDERYVNDSADSVFDIWIAIK